MPLPMKTLQEAAVELGMAESEIRTMVDLRKIRAVLKKGKLTFAPDELAKIRRLRKTVPESAQKSSAVAPIPAKVQTPGQRSGAILIRTPDAKILWRVTSGGFIERTVDGGATWEGQQLPDVKEELTAGAAPSAKVCWLLGTPQS